MLVIPEGVLHKSVIGQQEYEVVGGYPNGTAWDMIYTEPDKYLEASPCHHTDPVLGITGGLINIWTA